MPPVRFELTISGGGRPQTYALDRTTTGTGYSIYNTYKLHNYYIHTLYVFTGETPQLKHLLRAFWLR